MPALKHSEHRILIPQKLPHVRLMIHDDPRRIQLPRIQRRPRRHSEALRRIVSRRFTSVDQNGSKGIRPTDQWHIRHVVHHHTLMFRRVLCDPPKMGFDDVVTVKERQLASGLDPHLPRSRHSRTFTPWSSLDIPCTWRISRASRER